MTKNLRKNLVNKCKTAVSNAQKPQTVGHDNAWATHGQRTGQRTGQLKNLHLILLTHVSKRIYFDPASYSGWIKLAVIDHNENSETE